MFLKPQGNGLTQFTNLKVVNWIWLSLLLNSTYVHNGSRCVLFLCIIRYFAVAVSLIGWLTKYLNWTPEVMTPCPKIQYFVCVCFSSLQFSGVPNKACLTDGVEGGKVGLWKGAKAFSVPIDSYLKQSGMMPWSNLFSALGLLPISQTSWFWHQII